MSIVLTAAQCLTSTVKDVDDLEERLREANDIELEEEEDIKAELPLDIDLEDIQLTDQYQGLRLLPQEEENILPTIEFDTIINSHTPNETTATWSTDDVFNSMPPPQARRLS